MKLYRMIGVLMFGLVLISCAQRESETAHPMHWLMSDSVSFRTISDADMARDDIRVFVRHWGKSEDGGLWLLLVMSKMIQNPKTQVVSADILLKSRDVDDAFIHEVNEGKIELFLRGSIDTQVTLLKHRK